MEPTLQYIIELIKGAGDILNEGYGKTHTVDHKGPIDLVTEIDRKSEAFIVGHIKADFPSHSIIAEEGGKYAGAKGNRWFIDPVDGTSNYSRGLPMFSVSIAYAEKGALKLGCVYDPLRDECFSAEKGKGAHLNGESIHVSRTKELIDAMLVTGFPYDIHKRENNLDLFVDIIKEVHSVRRLGSAALDLAYVANGRLDGYWEIGIEPWDIAAGALIVREAGGSVTTTHDDQDFMKPPYDILASNGGIHDKLLPFFTAKDRE